MKTVDSKPHSLVSGISVNIRYRGCWARSVSQGLES